MRKIFFFALMFLASTTKSQVFETSITGAPQKKRKPTAIYPNYLKPTQGG